MHRVVCCRSKYIFYWEKNKIIYSNESLLFFIVIYFIKFYNSTPFVRRARPYRSHWSAPHTLATVREKHMQILKREKKTLLYMACVLWYRIGAHLYSHWRLRFLSQWNVCALIFVKKVYIFMCCSHHHQHHLRRRILTCLLWTFWPNERFYSCNLIGFLEHRFSRDEKKNMIFWKSLWNLLC